MFGNGDSPPTVTETDVPELLDHDEYRELRERKQEIDNKIRELKGERDRLRRKLRDPSSLRLDSEERVDDILDGGDGGGTPLREVQDAELDVRNRIRRLERSSDTLSSEIRKMEPRASRDLVQRDETYERYEEIVEGLHEAAVELAKWADAEQRFRDSLGNNGVLDHGLHPCPFRAGQVGRRRHSPMRQFLELCRERHDLEPKGLDV